MAEVAGRTLDLDRLGAELAGRVDYRAWVDRLAPAVTAPPSTPEVPARLPGAVVTAPVMDAAGRGGARSTAERVAGMLAEEPDVGVAEVATRLGVSERT